MALYSAGYRWSTARDATWPVLFLLIALSGYLLTLAFATSFLADPRRRVLLAVLVAASFVKIPSTIARAARVRPEHEPLRRGASRHATLRDKRIASDEDYGAWMNRSCYAGAKYLGQNPPVKWTPDSLDAAARARARRLLPRLGQAGAGRGPTRFERVKEIDVPPAHGGQTKLTILRPL